MYHRPTFERHRLAPPLAFLPLAIVAGANIFFTPFIPLWYGATAMLALTPAAKPIAIEVSRQVGIWAVELALVLGILTVTTLAGVTESASGGLSLALAAMAAGGMDTLPRKAPSSRCWRSRG